MCGQSVRVPVGAGSRDGQNHKNLARVGKLAKLTMCSGCGNAGGGVVTAG